MLLPKYEKILLDGWKRKEPIPEYVLKRFEEQIVPQLGQAAPSDPYIQEQLQSIITANDVRIASKIIEDNASVMQSLTALVGRIQKMKAFASVGGVLTVGASTALGCITLGFFAGGWYFNFTENVLLVELHERKAKLQQQVAELQTQINKEQETLDKLQAKTWRLELNTYKDKSRWIVLPHGVEFGFTSKVEDGRVAIKIVP